MTAPIVRFEKWEGLGNDFILVAETAVSAEMARRLCDRRFGIGADGVLFVEGVGSARPRMVVYNADGSRPEMCGNGLRCVAGYVAAEQGATAMLTVATDAGDKSCSLVRRGPDDVIVTVAMGAARMETDLVVSAYGIDHRFACVDVGNPHAITFEPFDDATIDLVGPIVAQVPPEGTNVEFCRMKRRSGPTRIDVTVWERGVGRTLACGTGACAVAVVACEQGIAPWGEAICVALPGGELEITVEAGTRALSMRGPARRVFRGEVALG